MISHVAWIPNPAPCFTGPSRTSEVGQQSCFLAKSATDVENCQVVHTLYHKLHFCNHCDFESGRYSGRNAQNLPFVKMVDYFKFDQTPFIRLLASCVSTMSDVGETKWSNNKNFWLAAWYWGGRHLCQIWCQEFSVSRTLKTGLYTYWKLTSSPRQHCSALTSCSVTFMQKRFSVWAFDSIKAPTVSRKIRVFRQMHHK